MPRYLRSGTEPLDDVLREFGQVVKAARIERGLTQVQLSGLSGIAQPDVSAIENGRMDIRLGSVVKLAEAFDLAIRDLFPK